jgi:Zn-dependent oligopeptidase
MFILDWLRTGVSWVLVQFYEVLSNFIDPASGWTWALSIVGLVIVIRIALIPLFVKQIKAQRNLQIIQPQMKEIQKKYMPYPYIEGTHTYAGFGHLNGYSSMYYTYQWSLVIAKDIFTKFRASGLLDANVAQQYRESILAPGGARPAAELVEAFLGRPSNLDAYRQWLQSE